MLMMEGVNVEWPVPGGGGEDEGEGEDEDVVIDEVGEGPWCDRGGC